MDIQINKIGKIILGDDKNSFVKIIDDGENTGGYLILTSKTIFFTDCFDDWVENFESLKKYFEESNWEIHWMKN
jgi:hypothetical protein